MTQTMFARAAAPKSQLGLAVIVVMLACVVGGFILSSTAQPGPQRDELHAATAVTHASAS
jgi:hypothetical protein